MARLKAGNGRERSSIASEKSTQDLLFMSSSKSLKEGELNATTQRPKSSALLVSYFPPSVVHTVGWNKVDGKMKNQKGFYLCVQVSNVKSYFQ